MAVRNAATVNTALHAATVANVSSRNHVAEHSGEAANKTAQLLKEHEVLQKLYAHLKSNIAQLNKEEGHGKDDRQKAVERLQQRLAQERQQLNGTNLTSFQRNLLVNRSRTDERELQYWQHSNALHHSMYHTSLKMTHGLMKRVNEVMQAYKEVIATGKLSPTVAKSLKAVASNLPQALLQLQQELKRA